VTVALIGSTSGPLGAYGQQFVDGFEIGLEYATDGTGEAAGHPIDYDVLDDGGDSAKATTNARDAIAGGAGFIVGGGSSAIALQLASLAEQNDVIFLASPPTDELTGINDVTFRAGRSTHQDLSAALAALDDPADATALVLAQDTEFGAGNLKAAEDVLGAAGATVEGLLVAPDVTDFTPFAARVADDDADIVFLAWAGETASALFTALVQQGVLETKTVVAGLPDRATWKLLGPVGANMRFLVHYASTVSDSEANRYLIDARTEAGAAADLFNNDGFVAAQMLVRAIEEGGPDDLEAQIAALEGWEFEGPKGTYRVRAEDHELLQPMFLGRLVAAPSGEWDAEVLATLDLDESAPAVAE
jgi:branched-chain amino acid transport system substrate-binding protein